MGREFASAAARWVHLTEDITQPVIIGVSDTRPAAREWFRRFDSIKYSVPDYRELLDKPDIDAVYCAVPHNLHSRIYCDVIHAGKHLFGEKPFGIDRKANEEILQASHENPSVFVRCSSEYPFFPACRELIRWIQQKKFGKLIEVRAGFNHSSDLDANKPINWKRMVQYNGEYGCMGDLGLHIEHIPFRMGFRPQNVYAQLTKLITERPDGEGGVTACDTWDNAMLFCDTIDAERNHFPMYLETKRMKPGATNEWYIEVYGMKCAARFTTNDPNAFHYTQAWDKEQAWCRIDIGCKPQCPTITGSIFQFGFSDAILQMWAAYIAELEGQKVEFGCVRPEETKLSHILQTAALLSSRKQKVIDISDEL
jgi:predicted dehydrogenase